MIKMDKEDQELVDIFHGEEKPLHPDTVHITLGKAAVGVSKKENTSPSKAVDGSKEAQWEPAPHDPTQLEKLKACAKDALLFGGLSLVFFYFQQSGQMAMTASMPCIVTCVALAGFGVGKNIAGGKH